MTPEMTDRNSAAAEQVLKEPPDFSLVLGGRT
jgi:hypothetical protein